MHLCMHHETYESCVPGLHVRACLFYRMDCMGWVDEEASRPHMTEMSAWDPAVIKSGV